MQTSNEIFFKERQKFRQPWLLLIIIPVMVIVLGIVIVSFYQQIILNKPFGNNPMSDEALLIFSALMILFSVTIIWLFYKMEMTTIVNKENIYLRFYPFLKRVYKIKDVEKFQAITYKPIREYGGWGIRISIRGRGMAYNVSGDKGVELFFRNGRRLLIGSQKAEEFEKAIAQAKNISSL